MVTVMKQTANLKDNSISIVCRDKIPEKIMIDEKRLQQVVLNLLSNANKFTVRGKIELIYGLTQDKTSLEVLIAD